MKVTTLGTGEALFPGVLGHNSAFISWNGTELFVDFPASNQEFLRRIDRSLASVKKVLITHLHGDHINGLEQLAYYCEIAGGGVIKPDLYIKKELIDELWGTLKAGLSKTTKGGKELSDYFNVIPIEKTFEIDGQEFELIQTDHVPGMLSYGLYAKSKFYYSADSNVHKSFLESISDDVQLIFHDCHFWDKKIASHASLADLETLSEEIQKKTILMHYYDLGEIEILPSHIRSAVESIAILNRYTENYDNYEAKLNFERRSHLRIAAPLTTYSID